MTSIADEVDLILDDDQNTIDSAAKLFENCSKMQQIARALNQTKTPKKWTQTAQEKHEHEHEHEHEEYGETWLRVRGEMRL